jgi:hypothetical protein
MNRFQALALGIWEFIVGDDWPTAAGVALAIAATALLAGAGISSWWVLPVAVAVLLGRSLRRELRPHRHRQGHRPPR